jgi:DpnII restriction endonuclease
VIFVESSAATVTKNIIEIIRATEYAITDPKCFNGPPSDEGEVHARIEAVLRCVFPDLLTKPQITKPIKNFEPDTGLRSVRTLIEYKFVESLQDAKRVSDEILADTRGYVSGDWDRFIYVVYETKRVKRESEWENLMRSSGVGENARVIVISGEEPKSKRKHDRAGKSEDTPP